MDAEAILMLFAVLVISLVVAEWGTYRAEKRIKKGIAGAGPMLTKIIEEIKSHPEKHPDLAKAYSMFQRLSKLLENVMEEMEEETKKQQTKKEDAPTQ